MCVAAAVTSSRMRSTYEWRVIDPQTQKGRRPLVTAAPTSTGVNQLTVILRAFPFAFLGSVSVSTPLS